MYTPLPPLLVVLLAAVSDVVAEVASLGTCPDVRGGYYLQCGFIVCSHLWLCIGLKWLIDTLHLAGKELSICDLFLAKVKL